MKIAFFDLEGWEENIIRQSFPNDELVLSDAHLAPGTPCDADAISIFIDSQMTEATFAAAPNLKLVTTRSTGYDHIDLAAAKARKVAVSYVPGYGDNTVAEFAFGLLLSLTRKIYDAVHEVREAGSFSTKDLRGIDLKGKTIGVIGTGRIGREAVKIAKGFGMNVLAYDAFQDAAAAAELGFKYVPLEELLANSDAITLHCPLLPSTQHIVNKNNVGLIKKGAYLVNTARGGLVETDALVRALEDGTLAGAAIDVIEEEPQTKEELHFLESGAATLETLSTILENNILMKMPNVLITPHNAFNSQEALARILATTLDNIKSFAAGQPKNLVP